MKVWEISALQKSLKESIKARGFNYSEIADKLNVSEVTVKRLFTSEDPSFKRLTEVCKLIDISIFDLVSVTSKQSQKEYILTEDQDFTFANDEKLYFFFIELFSKNVDLIQSEYQLSKSFIHEHLRKLEKLGLLELHPNNKINILVKGSITWRKNGIMQQKFMLSRHLEYANKFTECCKQDNYYIASTEGTLSVDSLNNMMNELKSIVEKYRQVAAREKHILPKAKLIDIAWLVSVGEFKRDLKQTFNPE